MEAVEAVPLARHPAGETWTCRADGDDLPLAAFIALFWGTAFSLPFWIVVTAWLWA